VAGESPAPQGSEAATKGLTPGSRGRIGERVENPRQVKSLPHKKIFAGSDDFEQL
jgi:hypothetical protein